MDSSQRAGGNVNRQGSGALDKSSTDALNAGQHACGGVLPPRGRRLQGPAHVNHASNSQQGADVGYKQSHKAKRSTTAAKAAVKQVPASVSGRSSSISSGSSSISSGSSSISSGSSSSSGGSSSSSGGSSSSSGGSSSSSSSSSKEHQRLLYHVVKEVVTRGDSGLVVALTSPTAQWLPRT
eukprot:jgi/Chrzof1/2888/Cz12g02260.t1